MKNQSGPVDLSGENWVKRWRKRGRKILPIPIDSILPAKAASIPASASSTTAQSSGFTPNSFAANKKMQIIFY